MLLSFLFDYTVYNRILYNFLTINIFACVFFSFLWYDREINTYIFYQEDILMIALKLTNVKACMSHLLLMDTFDSFLLIEGEIMTFNTFKIDGFIQKNFYTSEELEQMGTLPEYAYWKQLREYCFSLIKGKKTPLGFRFVFSLSPKSIARLIEQNELGLNADDIQGLYLNLRYDSTGLQCITGTSFKSFSMDKSLEHAWDNMVQKFFQKKGLDFEIL